MKYKIWFIPQAIDKSRKLDKELEKCGKQLKTGTIMLSTPNSPFLVWIDKRWKKLDELSIKEKEKIIDLTTLPYRKLFKRMKEMGKKFFGKD